MVRPRDITADLRERAHDVRDSVSELAASAKDAAGDAAEQLRDSAVAQYRRGKQRALAAERSLEDHIREQPITSVLAAMSIGVLVGLLWRRR
ncbi:MAG: hypothetical protein U1E76_27925 [Planctomycetota bacterium]